LCNPYEREQVGIDLICISSRHTMRETGIGLKRSLLEKLDRPCCANGVRDDLIVLAMHHQHRHVYGLQILIKLGFGERLDAVVLCLDPSHDSLAPPVISDG